MKCSIAGDVEMIADVAKASLQMAFTELVYGEGSIAARGAAMDH